MKPTVTYEEILKEKQKKNICFVDVRSPKEYKHATIPGAINLPVLNDEIREEVGKLYVNGQIEKAKLCGVTAVSTQLPEMYANYQRLSKEYDSLVLFCGKGGMRSSSIFSLLKSLGMSVSRLKGGYKAYRHYVHEHLDKQLKKAHFITLYGLSGSGKTEILKHLSYQGAKVLDIEACANHRGSLLGSIGLSEPHTQKTFESLLFENSYDWQEGEVVFTEGESKRIGNVVMPVSLFTGIQQGEKICIEASMSKRVAQIHQDYITTNNQEELAISLELLKKYINEERVSQYQEQVRNHEADRVIESLLTSYYDPRYSYHKTSYNATFSNISPEKTAENILNWQQNKKMNKSNEVAE